MEYAKLFYNDWRQPPEEDLRNYYRFLLDKQWWENASEEEKTEMAIAMEKKRAVPTLCFEEIEENPYISERPQKPMSKYFHGESWNRKERRNKK